MIYRCEAASLEGFIKQLAVSYIGLCHCWFYVTGTVPKRLTRAEHDRRMIEKYDIDITKWTRSRKKRAGIAPVHYLRYQDFWVLCAGHGRHKFFDNHVLHDLKTGQITSEYRDVRKHAIKVHFNWIGERLAYSVSFSNQKARISIDKASYKLLKGHFIETATKRSLDQLINEFYHLPFEPYGPITKQLFCVLRAVNRARKVAGLKAVPHESIWLRRKPVKVFVREISREAECVRKENVTGAVAAGNKRPRAA